MKFCIKNDIQCISPEKLELSKIQSKEVNYLSEEEVDKIMNAPKQHKTPNALQIARDEAILWFLYGSGLRVTELTHITRDQIKTDSNQFAIVGK